MQMVLEKQYNGEGVGGEMAANDYLCSFLNFLPRLIPEKVVSMQKHTETDETFVLLKGKAVLFLADGKDKPERITSIKLEKEKTYTVPLGVWHAPVMSKDGKILLIENNHTTDDNSPRMPLTEEQMKIVHNLGKAFYE